MGGKEGGNHCRKGGGTKVGQKQAIAKGIETTSSLHSGRSRGWGFGWGQMSLSEREELRSERGATRR